MRYWRRIDDGDLMIAENFPMGYIGIMQARAHAWGRPVVEAGNVIGVNFGLTGRRIGQSA